MPIGRPLEFSEKSNDVESLDTHPIGRKIEFKPREVSRLRSLLSAFPKGAATEILDVARGIRSVVGLEERPEGKKARKFLEENLPTQPEFIEKGLERAGRIAPYTLIPGGGGLVGGLGRSALAGFAGQTAEELGAGELGQTITEIAALGAPGLGRKIIPTRGQEKLINFARKTGMTDKEIAPLLPNQKKKSFFGKMASKGEKTQKSMQETRQAISRAYDFVKESPAASAELSPTAMEKFLRDSSKIAKEMPFEIRKQISQDAMDLLEQGPSGSNLINFYQDISSRYKLGREQLERLKKPIIEALESISPELGDDFKLTNEMYKRGLAMRKALKPKAMEDLLQMGEAGVFAHGFLSGRMDILVKILGIEGARKLSAQMLSNPRLQNISKQIAKASNEGKFAQAESLANYLITRYKENKKDQD